MDSILRKFENRMDIIGPDGKGHEKLMINSLSYCLNLCLGFLWYHTDLAEAERKIIIASDFQKKNTEGDKKQILDKLFQGEKDELTQELFSAEGLQKLVDFVRHRNDYAHTFIYIDIAQENFKSDMIQLKKHIPMLSSGKDISFVVLMKLNEKTGAYEAWRYTSDGSLPTKVSISPKRIDKKGEELKEFPRTFMELDGKYYKLSPFVHIDPIEDQAYVFSTLKSPEDGKFKLNALYPRSGDRKDLYRDIRFSEFRTASACSYDKAVTDPDTGILVSSFKPNYIEDAYVENITGIEERIKSQVSGNESRSSVICTIWGHGGVGKTACVQHLIKKLSKDKTSSYEVIVFASAKNREFDIELGNINTLDGAICGCDDVVREIMRVWQQREVPDNELGDAYEEIAEFGTDGSGGRLLVVIDDFETLPDIEKEKIFGFFGKASAEYVKVLITTRNRNAISTGTRIDVSELNLDETRTFIVKYLNNLAKLDGSFNSIEDNLNKLSDDENAIKEIFEATKGRMIALRYVCNELRAGSCAYDEHMKDFVYKLGTSSEMMKFLYGNAFMQMGENGPDAEKVFAAISGIVDEKTLEFDASELVRMLIMILDDIGEDRLYKLLSLLEDWKLIDVIKREEDKPVRARLSEDTLLALCDSLFEGEKYVYIKEKEREYFVERSVDLRRDANKDERGPRDLALKEVAAMRAAPSEIRRAAVYDGAKYLESNPQEWKKYYELCLKYLPDDEEINCDYVYKLWGKRRTNEEFAQEAVDFSKRFFRKPERRVNARKNWQFPKMYALEVSYITLLSLLKQGFIDWDKNILINVEELSDNDLGSLRELFSDYGKHLLEDSDRYTSKDSENTRFGQACLKIGLLLQLLARDKEYRDIGIEMCNMIAPENTDDPNPYNISPNDLMSFDKLRKIFEGTVTVDKGLATQSQLQELIDREVTFHAENFITTKSGKVQLVIGHIAEGGYRASVHISKVANRVIKNLEDEFKVGQDYPARAIGILKNGAVELSTVEFRS